MTHASGQNETSARDGIWLPDRFSYVRCIGKSPIDSQSAFHSALATDLETQRLAHIRLVKSEFLHADGLFQFQSHLDSLTRVDSPNFQKPIHWGNESGFLWCAHDYLDGAFPCQSAVADCTIAIGGPDDCDSDTQEPAGSFLSNYGTERTINVGIRLLETLHEIHATGCLQQDLRLSQILIEGENVRLVCPSPTMFVKSELRPQEWSMAFAQIASPELVGAIDHDIGVASDVYSVGIFLYWLVSGRLPFRGQQIGEILLQHLTAQPDYGPLSSLPQPLLQIIEKMLLKEPRDRYQSAFAAAHDLGQVKDILNGAGSGDQFTVGRFDKRETLTDPSFVGRQEELSTINSAVTQANSGTSQSIIVHCPSGIGKTRLVVESLRFANQHGFEIYRGQGVNQIAQPSGGPILQVIKQIQSRPHLHPRLREVLKKDRELIGSVFPEFAIDTRLFESQSALQRDTKEISGAEGNSQPDFSQNRSVAAFCKILTAISSADQPALFWFDDCQWFDPQAIDILQTLLKSAPPYTCVILSMRSDEGASGDFFRTIKPDVLIEPHPLTDQEIHSLIESMAGILPEEAIHISTSLSSGSPFMATAILRGMVETGALELKDGDWVINSGKLSLVKTCSNAAEALLVRLENVDHSMLEILSVAALIGKQFKASMVTGLCEFPVDQARACVLAARQQRLIWSTPDGTLTFVHDKIRETLIGRLPAPRRKELHYRLATSMAKARGEGSGFSSNSEIAYHFDAAGKSAEGFSYAMAAAERMLSIFSLETAVQMLLIAYRGVDKDNQSLQHEIEDRLARTLMLDGRYEMAAPWFEKASRSAQTDLATARIEESRGELAFKRGDKLAAVHFLERALSAVGGSSPKTQIGCLVSLAKELAVQTAHSLFPRIFVGRQKIEASEPQRLRWRIYSRLAHGYWYTRERSITVLTHLKYMNEAEAFPPTPELGQAWSEHAPAMSLIPWSSRGKQYARKSITLRKEMNDLWGQGQSYNFFAILTYATSDFDDCLRQARIAESILLKTGDYWEVNIARFHIAGAMFHKGQLGEAVEFCKQTYDAASKIGDYQSTGNIVDIWAHAAQGDIPLSVIETEESRNLRDDQRTCQLLSARGIHSIGQQQYDAAVEYFQSAVALSERRSVINSYTTPAYSWLATALRLRWENIRSASLADRETDTHLLSKQARRAVKIGKRFRNHLPHALREMGYAHLIAGRAAKARIVFEKSVAVAQQQGARYQAALTRIAYGEYGAAFDWPHHAEVGAAGKTELEQIHEVSKGVGGHDSISLLDRFDALLDAGQQIAASVDEVEIFRETLNAGVQLLRGSSTMIITNNAHRSPRDSSQSHLEIGDWAVRSMHGSKVETFLIDLVLSAAREGKTIIQDKAVAHDGKFESASLCSPIIVGGKPIACLYASNRLLKGMYGSNEIRIAEYLTSAAGAALEKAEGFRQLETLNHELEQRVVDRTRTIEARSQQLELTASELTQTQKELTLARDEAQEADRTKSEFLARMSHEIRTPISAVIGFTDLMLRGIIADPKERRKKLETIQGSGQHLLELVNDLLDLSKIEAGKLAVDLADCVPVKIVSDVIESLQSRAIENGNTLKLNFEGSLPKSIVSDRRRLKQIITNVVGNAIKFTKDGQITTTLSFLEGDSATLQIAVEDSGIGMTKEQLLQVFDPFVQADPSVTRQYGGTGLGLAISQQLVRSLGGEITVTSELGVGTTFVISLEIAADDWLEMLSGDAINELLDNPAESDFLTADLTGITIFYADDAETNRDLIRLLLTQSGATVQLAENGEQAFNRLTNPDDPEYCPQAAAVIMDMQMPVMDGYSATRRLRDNGFEKPIIAFTANTMIGDREKCIDAGCSDFLSKPIDSNQLLVKIANACGVETRRRSRSTMEAVVMDDSLGNASGSLKSEFDVLEPVMQPFAKKFLQKFYDRLPEFSTSVNERDETALHQLAHWAKGTSGTVGLSTFATLCTELDNASTGDDWSKTDACLARLLEYVEPYPDQ